MIEKRDKVVIRELATKYDEAAKSSENLRRRELIRAHNAKRTRIMPMLTEMGLWNKWVRDMFCKELQCCSNLAREMEASLKFRLFMFYHAGDDRPLRPYYSLNAVLTGLPVFGIEPENVKLDVDGGAYRINPVIHSVLDFEKIKRPHLSIDEKATKILINEAKELTDGQLEIDLCRGPFLRGLQSDLSNSLGNLMGIENFMLFPHLYPDDMHELLSRMSEGVVALLRQNELDGNVSRSGSFNQYEPYYDDIPDPVANSHGCKLNTLAGFFASQEYTGVSPKQHEEFLLRYQRPIMECYAHVAYGCCENLTEKIDILRSVKTLHAIAVTPFADVGRCARQIGSDYVISWRPNPVDTVSTGFDERRIRNLLRRSMESLSGCYAHIMLKDVETVQGEPERIRMFFDLARDEAVKFGRN